MIGNATVVLVSTTTTTDPDGNSTVVEVETPLTGCAIAPRSSTERADPRSPAVLTDASLYGPFDATIDADDTVRVSGHSPAMDGDWRIEGTPGAWASPFTGRKFGLEVALKRAG